MRKDLKVETLLYPMPVLIIGTFDKDGKPDAMNAAWGGIYDYNKVMICLSSHKTTDNIRLNGCFTISFATRETITASDYVGIVSQNKEPNKITKAGLTFVKGSKVNAPIFEQYPLTLECKVTEVMNEGEGGGNFVGEIVNISADENILTNGKIDALKAHFVSYEGATHRYLELTKEVAKAFQEGLKIK